MAAQWHVFGRSILITKTSTDTIILHVGDCICYAGRKLCIRIERFTGNNKNGPIGIEYLPWRGYRWAKRNGKNPRHIICFPEGYSHYGRLINWDTVIIVPNPSI